MTVDPFKIILETMPMGLMIAFLCSEATGLVHPNRQKIEYRVPAG